LNSIGYHLCTTEIGDARYIYRTCLKKGGDVEFKTTIKTNELPMRPVSGEVWPASLSMKDSVRSGFNKGEKDTRLSYVLWSLYYRALFFRLSCMYGIFASYMYSWITISSLRKVISAIIWIWFLSIWLETQRNSRRHSIQ
jgi:hypothetical protein